MGFSKGIKIYSEVGQLRSVLLHRPGEEIENITPKFMGRLLFDDIPYLKVAREEHESFANILRDNGAEVVYLLDSVAEVLEDEEIKNRFIEDYLNEAFISGEGMRKNLKSFFSNFTDLKILVSKMMSGVYKTEIENDKILSLGDIVEGSYPFVVDPMPNLYFTRDPAAVIGRGVTINKMKTVTRCRETLFTKYIFSHHDKVKGLPVKQYYDRTEPYSIEGGDELVLSNKVVAIGISERTETRAIEALAKRLFANGEPFETILAFNIPNKRAFMHLDTVFTMVDKDAFTIHPEIEPILKVYSIKKDGDKLRYTEETEPLDKLLSKYLEVDNVRLIRCGDGHPITAAREQWNDGSNTLAIAPGHVVVYSRNYVTNRIMEEAGIKLHVMPSSELSRGRGGPRCMSMPLCRDDL